MNHFLIRMYTSINIETFVDIFIAITNNNKKNNYNLRKGSFIFFKQISM